MCPRLWRRGCRGLVRRRCLHAEAINGHGLRAIRWRQLHVWLLHRRCRLPWCCDAWHLLLLLLHSRSLLPGLCHRCGCTGWRCRWRRLC